MNDRMHFLTAITLALSVLLIIAIRLLFRFSYDSFIPWDLGFGVFLYIVFFFCTIIASEVYFFNTKFSAGKRLAFKILPAALNALVVGFILYFFYYKTDDLRCSDCGGVGLGYLFFEVVSLIVTTTFFVILSQIRLDTPYDPIYKPDRYKSYLSSARLLGNLIQKVALIVIPVLIILIIYIGLLTLTDYKAAGEEYSHTNKSNRNLMYDKVQDNLDISFCDHIKNPLYDKSQYNCYQYFFKQLSSIKQAKKNKNITSLKAGFFLSYNENKQYCIQSKKPNSCTQALLEQTQEILE